jgi:hypothetical protein
LSPNNRFDGARDAQEAMKLLAPRTLSAGETNRMIFGQTSGTTTLEVVAVPVTGTRCAQRLIIGGASSVSKQCPGFGIVLVTGHGY